MLAEYGHDGCEMQMIKKEKMGAYRELVAGALNVMGCEIQKRVQIPPPTDFQTDPRNKRKDEYRRAIKSAEEDV